MPVYWAVSGLMCWALFLIAHDCSHRSFSRSNFVCDAVGNIAHTFVMVRTTEFIQRTSYQS